jgi:hypothetical protein
MSKTLDTEKYTIGSLLGRYERRRVVLPEFQRSYSWEKAHVLKFLDDLCFFESEFSKTPLTASYFLGPIVVIQHEDHILLLDGQQRLATASIVLAAMRDIARGLDSKPGPIKGGDLARDIQRELIEKDSEPVAYSLTLGELDEPFFLKAIKTDPPAFPSTKLRSHLLIQNAYRLSSERLTQLLQGNSYDGKLRRLKSLSDTLSKGMAMVGIVVKSEEDAYRIFETLNDRGLRLSVPDLALNLLMRRAPDGMARGLVRQQWNSMLREMARRDVSRFLRHMWVSQYGDLKAEGLFTAITKHLEASTLTSTQYADQCADECESYVALLDVNVPLPKGGVRDLQGIVKYLQIASAPPLLLAGYRCLSQADFTKLLHAVVVTYIRYVLVTNQNPLDFESACYEGARELRSLCANGKPSGAQLTAAKSRLRKLSVTDDAMRKAITELTLERSEALWLLTQIANAMQSGTKEVGMDKANLEHVFPQNAGPAWANRDELEPYVWHVGNLTILGERLNKKAQNRPFNEKITQYYSKSEIVMTKELLSIQTWNPTTIQTRAKKLARWFISLWKAI